MSFTKEKCVDENVSQSYSRKNSPTQNQTADTFAFKWAKRETYESKEVKKKAREWLYERYLDKKPEKLQQWFSGGRKKILDAGCGAGLSAVLLFGDYLMRHDYLGVDISDAVFIAKNRFKEYGYPGRFIKTSILDLPIPNKSLDIIFSEGVLHHTDSTEKSIYYLSSKLKKDGLFLFYVYAKKAVIREYTDDYVREKLKSLTNEEAWEALKPLTKLGIALGKLNIEINIPECIPFLGIPAGKVDIQRFFYWNICKLYYRPDFNIEEMNHVNFDWFRPLNCHRHTKEEIISYCDNAGLVIEHMNVQESGITTIAKKSK